jgi:hypothetical protein
VNPAPCGVPLVSVHGDGYHFPIMDAVVYDLDRTLIRTGAMITWSAERAETVGILKADEYLGLYAQCRECGGGRISFPGFTRFLVAEAGMSEEEAVTLSAIHDTAVSQDLSYPGARELLAATGPERSFILTRTTPEATVLQWQKIRSAGFDRIVPPSHIRVVSDKSDATLREVFAGWGLEAAGLTVHVNDSPGELVSCCAIQPDRSVGVLFVDSPYATADEIQYARERISMTVVGTFPELAAVCRQALGAEGNPGRPEYR